MDNRRDAFLRAGDFKMVQSTDVYKGAKKRKKRRKPPIVKSKIRVVETVPMAPVVVREAKPRFTTPDGTRLEFRKDSKGITHPYVGNPDRLFHRRNGKPGQPLTKRGGKLRLYRVKGMPIPPEQLAQSTIDSVPTALDWRYTADQTEFIPYVRPNDNVAKVSKVDHGGTFGFKIEYNGTVYPFNCQRDLVDAYAKALEEGDDAGRRRIAKAIKRKQNRAERKGK